jgi:hypothetical protein
MNTKTKRKREAGKKARNGRTQKKEGGRKERERERSIAFRARSLERIAVRRRYETRDTCKCQN